MPKFQPGQSGNPAGRPKGTGLVAICTKFADEEGFDKLIELARGTGYRIGKDPKTGRVIHIGPSPELQFEALKLALAYGKGKPVAPVDVAGDIQGRMVLVFPKGKK